MAASNPTLEILKPRADWIVRRKAEAARTGDTNLSQMHFARKGLLTEEMAYVAQRENLAVEVVRDEVAAGTQNLDATCLTSSSTCFLLSLEMRVGMTVSKDLTSKKGRGVSATLKSAETHLGDQ